MAPQPTRPTTWIAIADGAKALVAENEGTDRAPRLRMLDHRDLDIPPARELASDRPGRMHDNGPGQRSATEETDFHEAAKADFVRDLAARLNRAAQEGRFDRLVLVVPPRVLGQLRPALSEETARRVVREIGKDLVKQPVPQIEEQLAGDSWE